MRRLLLRPLHHLRYNSSSSSSSGPPLTLTTTPAPHYGVITTLTLSAARSRNALSTPVISLLHTSLTTSLPPQTRALILRSSVPAVFCAGADLRERRAFTSSQTLAFLDALNNTLNTLAAIPIPTIAAIDGYALGGGLELALAADIRVAGPNAVLGLPETRVGVIPGAGGTWRLAEVVGRGRAKEMILTGRRVRGTEAVQMGLVARLAEEGGVDVLAEEVAKECCEGAPLAVRAAKRVLGRGEEEERRGYLEILESRDRREALEAFSEKRKVVWKGE